ncbi:MULTISPECIES: phosphate/phosphite/phosphonate ABC transporter substrate-binding protein [unclassified Limnobacter]|uniref:phosphate/phosphite/phosphonate ABC transporter substrate-binding protein n=1 Tax=unclassified Limnobacter TaxID=2630203 RepID=UPI000C5B8543|nr:MULTISPECIES: PhnD/SsuA/transferrin family substrate-binding protein [unclassified Limnobacter]MAG80892.1 ABC transporter substrate-binding protein [Sutterellaceae bacterium]MBT84466.1 ABC transporter substrate-binding protein [Sutterellaceae bacterium]HAV74908.1 ABC transporter substrate-binding protein [Limnobacter sp.]|tara:strand:+ start:1983 stop:2816 length:834 start_codon:yes stop_codon:yes gene_type:complete
MLRLLISLCLLMSSLQAQAQQPVYRFSPVNQWDIPKTAAYWNPIIQYVSQQSGVQLELKIGRTSADTTAYVLAQEVEFVFSNHLFSPERDKLGWKVFGRRTGPALQGQIAVLDNSPIRTLEELSKQDMVFAGPEAFVGYRVPQAELMNRGIEVNAVFAGNQNAAFAQLLAGKAKAVGSNSALIDGFTEKQGTKFRVLWTSESYLDLALMASGKVSTKDVRAVTNAFINMHKSKAGALILEQASASVGMDPNSHFLPAYDKDYESYRRFYATAPMAVR